jgi:hypothetical protein
MTVVLYKNVAAVINRQTIAETAPSQQRLMAAHVHLHREVEGIARISVDAKNANVILIGILKLLWKILLKAAAAHPYKAGRQLSYAV